MKNLMLQTCFVIQDKAVSLCIPYEWDTYDTCWKLSIPRVGSSDKIRKDFRLLLVLLTLLIKGRCCPSNQDTTSSLLLGLQACYVTP